MILQDTIFQWGYKGLLVVFIIDYPLALSGFGSLTPMCSL